MHIEVLSRGIDWLDTGTFHSLHETGSYVLIIEVRLGVRIGRAEKLAWRKSWIPTAGLHRMRLPCLAAVTASIYLDNPTMSSVEVLGNITFICPPMVTLQAGLTRDTSQLREAT